MSNQNNNKMNESNIMVYNNKYVLNLKNVYYVDKIDNVTYKCVGTYNIFIKSIFKLSNTDFDVYDDRIFIQDRTDSNDTTHYYGFTYNEITDKNLLC